MTRQQAIKVYLKPSVYAEIMIRRLMLWDSRLTLTGNGKKLGVRGDHLYNMKRIFNLKCKMVGKGNYERKPTAKKS